MTLYDRRIHPVKYFFPKSKQGLESRLLGTCAVPARGVLNLSPKGYCPAVYPSLLGLALFDDFNSLLLGLFLLTVCVIAYFVPAMVAWGKKHSSRIPILILNIFLGWTLIGWVAALVWALIPEPVTPIVIEQQVPLFCSTCGKYSMPGAQFCAACGAPLWALSATADRQGKQKALR